MQPGITRCIAVTTVQRTQQHIKLSTNACNLQVSGQTNALHTPYINDKSHKLAAAAAPAQVRLLALLSIAMQPWMLLLITAYSIAEGGPTCRVIKHAKKQLERAVLLLMVLGRLHSAHTSCCNG